MPNQCTREDVKLEDVNDKLKTTGRHGVICVKKNFEIVKENLEDVNYETKTDGRHCVIHVNSKF